MQRPIRGYRGGIRIGPHITRNHRIQDDDNGLSISNSDEVENVDDNENDLTLKSTSSSKLSSITVSPDFESAVRNLRSSATRQKKNKIKANISSQKADLPQLTHIDDTSDNTNNKQSKYWFPKI